MRATPQDCITLSGETKKQGLACTASSLGGMGLPRKMQAAYKL